MYIAQSEPNLKKSLDPANIYNILHVSILRQEWTWFNFKPSKHIVMHNLASFRCDILYVYLF